MCRWLLYKGGFTARVNIIGVSTVQVEFVPFFTNDTQHHPVHKPLCVAEIGLFMKENRKK